MAQHFWSTGNFGRNIGRGSAAVAQAPAREFRPAAEESVGLCCHVETLRFHFETARRMSDLFRAWCFRRQMQQYIRDLMNMIIIIDILHTNVHCRYDRPMDTLSPAVQ